jgi:hypothetical protein
MCTKISVSVVSTVSEAVYMYMSCSIKVGVGTSRLQEHMVRIGGYKVLV